MTNIDYEQEKKRQRIVLLLGLREDRWYHQSKSTGECVFHAKRCEMKKLGRLCGSRIIVVYIDIGD